MRNAGIAALLVILGSGSLAQHAVAATFSHAKGLLPATTTEHPTAVDFRPYRHCHRSYGRRWCHGGRPPHPPGFGPPPPPPPPPGPFWGPPPPRPW
jgi:hypothetical protein